MRVTTILVLILAAALLTGCGESAPMKDTATPPRPTGGPTKDVMVHVDKG